MRSAKATILLFVLLLSMASQWLHDHREHGGRLQCADHHAVVGERCFFCEHIAFQPTGMAGLDCLELVVYKGWNIISFQDITFHVFSPLAPVFINKGPPLIFRV